MLKTKKNEFINKNLKKYINSESMKREMNFK